MEKINKLITNFENIEKSCFEDKHILEEKIYKSFIKRDSR